MADLIDRYRSHTERLLGAGVVIGSNIAPERITNPHIRAHAYEGQLFRTVVEAEARRHRSVCLIVLEREIYATAVRALGRTEKELRRAIADMGRGLAGPWRAEQKAAALAAWIVLIRSRRSA